jgi:hypothetical protein
LGVNSEESRPEEAPPMEEVVQVEILVGELGESS